MLKLSEFSLKDVIDDNTGNKLGRIIDLEINQDNGKIESIIVGKGFRFINLITSKELIEIPYENVLKNGNDVIVVEMPKIKKDKTVENK